MGVRLRHLSVALAVVAAAVSATPSAPAAGMPAPRHVVLWGDSLLSQSGPVAQYVLQASGQQAELHAWPGTALCDWTGHIVATVAQEHPTDVVLLFSGNDEPCDQGLTAPAGAGRLARADDLAALYRRDLNVLLDRLAPYGVQVWLNGAPAIRPGVDTAVGSAPIRQVYEDIASQRPSWVHYTDAGRALLDANGRYAPVLPCSLPGESCFLGVTRVRASDGVHLCDNCDDPNWQGGRLRLGFAIVAPLAARYGF